MSQIETAKTKCPCGAELQFKIKKPSYFDKTVSKVSCFECDSRFLMIVEVDKTHKIPMPKNHRELMALATNPFVRKYSSRFEIIRLTPQAKERAKNPIRQLASTIIEKVSKKDLEPEF